MAELLPFIGPDNGFVLDMMIVDVFYNFITY